MAFRPFVTRLGVRPLLQRQSVSSLVPYTALPAPYSRALHTTYSLRSDAVEPPDHLSGPERAVFDKLKAELSPSKLEVQDISGGCGSMYGLDIVSDKFAGLSVIKQHKLVNKVLAEEIKGWHGVQLKTKAP